jgi:periplasmic protein CpxP/Spy
MPSVRFSAPNGRQRRARGRGIPKKWRIATVWPHHECANAPKPSGLSERDRPTLLDSPHDLYKTLRARDRAENRLSYVGVAGALPGFARGERDDKSQHAALTETPPRHYRLWIVLALAAGLTIGLLTAAFAQSYGWHSDFMGGWHRGGWGRGGPLSPAQIDDRIDRGSKHLAIELDATAEQQQKLATIAKSALHDLLPLREKAQAARGQALALLTAPVDREAIERLRAEQMGVAEMASKRIAQALGDASDVLTPEQRRKIADRVTASHGPPWARWRHD